MDKLNANPQINRPHKANIKHTWEKPTQINIQVAHIKPMWVSNGQTEANPHTGNPLKARVGHTWANPMQTHNG